MGQPPLDGQLKLRPTHVHELNEPSLSGGIFTLWTSQLREASSEEMLKHTKYIDTEGETDIIIQTKLYNHQYMQ